MKRKPMQLSLPVRMYRVSCGEFGDIDITAGTAAAARYEIYRRAHEAGFFRKGFRDFLSRKWPARALRR